MDKEIRQILNKISSHGYEAYVVGGYVRDLLFDMTTYDVDICTNALPEDICKLFKVDNNNYGCVNVKGERYNFDITTYRKESNYENRRPTKITFVQDLEEDLVRRDFTLNTLCMDKDGNVIDKFGGIHDLKNKVIRMVGDISKRLEDDPLRILRAIRFATIYDFEIEESLLKEIKKKNILVNTLSKNRVKEEMDKILKSENFNKGLNIMKDCGLLEVLNITYDRIKYTANLDGMWAQLKVLDIPFTNDEKSNIIKINEVLDNAEVSNESLYKYGIDINVVAGTILGIDANDIYLKYLKMPIKSKEDIDITSIEIEKIFGSKKVISSVYENIGSLILEGKLENKNQVIRDYLKKEVIKDV